MVKNTATADRAIGVPLPGPVITRRIGASATTGTQNVMRLAAPMLRRRRGTSEANPARAMAARFPHRNPHAAFHEVCHRLRP